MDVYIYNWIQETSDFKSFSNRLIADGLLLQESNKLTPCKVIVRNYFPNCYIFPKYKPFKDKEGINGYLSDTWHQMLRVANEKQEQWTQHVKKTVFVKRRILFPASDLSYPCIKVIFDNSKFMERMKTFVEINFSGAQLQVYEASYLMSFLKFFSENDLCTVGWHRIERAQTKILSTYNEINCSVDQLHKSEREDIVFPAVLSFDIEVHSSRFKNLPDAFPNASIPGDVITKISIAFQQRSIGTSTEKRKRYLISLKCKGQPNEPMENDVEMIDCDTEMEVIYSFSCIVKKLNPDVKIEFNGYGFDYPYIYERAKYVMNRAKINGSPENEVWKRLFPAKNGAYRAPSESGLGYTLLNMARYGKTEKFTRYWSNAGYGENHIFTLNGGGYICCDMLKYVINIAQKKLSSFSLDEVAYDVLGLRKVDLDKREMFRIFDSGDKEGMKLFNKYAMTDSDLTLDIYCKMETWITLQELARITNIPILYLYTRGMGIRTFASIVRRTTPRGIVINRRENEGIIDVDKSHYSGATVFDPILGWANNVAVFDFKSLYPSIIIWQNISFDTCVLREGDEEVFGSDLYKKPPEIRDFPREDCNVVTCRLVEKDAPTSRIREAFFLKREIKKGLVPEMLEDLLSLRAETNKKRAVVVKRLKEEQELTADEKRDLSLKSTLLFATQLALKLTANSVYGIMGARNSYFPMLIGAEAVTSCGRELIETVKHAVEKFGAVVLYGDSDSAFVQLRNDSQYSQLWKKHGGQIGLMMKDPDYVEPNINKDAEHQLKDICKRINDEYFTNPIYLEYEKMFEQLVLLTKKFYTGLLYMGEGRQPEPANKGNVAVRRDRIGIVRDAMRECFVRGSSGCEEGELFLTLLPYLLDLKGHNVPCDKLALTVSVKEKTMKSTNKVQGVVAQKIIKRGGSITPGSRLTYLLVHINVKCKTDRKNFLMAEDITYYKNNKDKDPSLYPFWDVYVEKMLDNYDKLIQVLYQKSRKNEILSRLKKMDAVIDEYKTLFVKYYPVHRFKHPTFIELDQ